MLIVISMTRIANCTSEMNFPSHKMMDTFPSILENLLMLHAIPIYWKKCSVMKVSIMILEFF